jgi:hypothetical protein
MSLESNRQAGSDPAVTSVTEHVIAPTDPVVPDGTPVPPVSPVPAPSPEPSTPSPPVEQQVSARLGALIDAGLRVEIDRLAQERLARQGRLADAD